MEEHTDKRKSKASDEDLWILSLVDGSISQEDFESLKAWACASSENRNYVRRRVETLFSMGVLNDKTSFREEDAYKRFLNHISGDTSSNKPLHFRSITWKMMTAVAAVVLLAFLIGYQVAVKSMRGGLAQMEMKTAEGSSAVVNLPDGTIITLSPKSRVSYSQGYGIEDREVLLYGEGYFQVRHSPDMEFRVRSDMLTVTDKGTEFRVRNYETENTASVELMKGKVLLDNALLNSSDSSLKPGELVVMNKQSGYMVKTKAAKDPALIYILTFEDMRLERVVAILSKAYGVKIYISKSAKNKLFNGVFDMRKDDLTKILDAMSATHQVSYREEKGVYYIY